MADRTFFTELPRLGETPQKVLPVLPNSSLWKALILSLKNYVNFD